MADETFIGRTRELEVLKQAVTRRGGSFIPIYGRRRVGKSELILHFLKKCHGLYFLGKQAAATQQIREFLRGAAQATQAPVLRDVDPESGWGAALRATLDA